MHTQRLYWLAAVDFASGYSTLHLDKRYRTMVDVGLDFSGAQPQGAAPEHFGREGQVPIIEVAFKHDKWWSIPQFLSAQLYHKHVNNEDAVHAWDWGEDGRTGSWTNDGEETKISRYHVNFTTSVQTNLDNQRKRSIRIIWVRAQDVLPQFTGQLPTTEQ